MKHSFTIQRLCLFLFILVLTIPAWAQGTEVVSISSAAEWKAFCQRVNNNGETTLNAKLTQDVDLGTEIVQVGNSIEMYKGTFDGQGHTLSFDWTSQGGFAPFDFVNGGTIKNLRTKGKITTSGGEASGLLGNA